MELSETPIPTFNPSKNLVISKKTASLKNEGSTSVVREIVLRESTQELTSLIVDVLINSVSTSTVLDTGAQVVVISTELATKFTDPVMAESEIILRARGPTVNDHWSATLMLRILVYLA